MGRINTVENQKTVKIGKRIKRSKESYDHYYATMNLNALQEAMSSGMTETALKLWLYFNKNQDDYEMALSQKDCAEWGISKTSYYNGVKELIRRGFLVPLNAKETIFEFRERPEQPKIETSVCVEEESNSHSKPLCSRSEQELPQKDREIEQRIHNYKLNNTEEQFRDIWYNA